MARRRVLVQPSIIEQAYILHQQGVPITKLLRDNNIKDNISRPAFVKLLKYYKLFLKADAHDAQLAVTIYNSLFPLWLIIETDNVIQQPYNYVYKDLFPFGVWVEENWIK